MITSKHVARIWVGAVVALLAVLCLSAPAARAQCPPPAGTYTSDWTTGNGNWSNAAQWNTNCSPNNVDSSVYFNVQIIGSGSDTITLDTSVTIDSLQLGMGETLTDNGVAQSLTIGSSNFANPLDAILNNAGTITLSNGGSTLTIDASSLPSSSNINESNTGTINLSNGATLYLNDGGNKDAFFFNSSGSSGNINLNGGFIIGQSGDEQLQSYTTINNTGAPSLIQLDLINNGNVNVTGDLTIRPTGMSANPGVANIGTMTVNAGSGNALIWDMSMYQGPSLAHPGAAFYNAGNVNVGDQGALVWTNPSLNTGYIANEGTITLGSGPSGGAALELSSGTPSPGTGAGVFDVGPSSGTGQIIMNGASAIVGDYGNELLINDVNHTIEAAPGSSAFIYSLDLVNKGTITSNGFLDIAPSGNSLQPGVLNSSTGVMTSNNTLVWDATFYQGSSLTSPSFNNQGLVNVSDNAYLTLSNPNGNTAYFNNDGTINIGTISGASLALLGNSSSTSTFDLGSNAGTGTLNLVGSSYVYGIYGNELLINDTGHTIEAAPGSFSYISSLDLVNKGTITSNGFLDIKPYGNSQQPGVLNSSTGVMTSNNALFWDATVYQGSSLTSPAFNNQGVVNVSDNASLGLLNPNGNTAYFNNDGTINIGTISGATLALFGNSSSTSTFDLGSNAGTGTLNLVGSSLLYGYYGNELLINDTGHTIQGSGYIDSLDLINNGNITAMGALSIQPSGMSTSPGVLNNGTMSVAAANPISSTLYWDATVYPGTSLSSPAFNNQGTVNVGDGSYLEFQAPVGGEAYFNNGGTINIGTSTGANLVLAGSGSTFDLGTTTTGVVNLYGNSYIYGFNANETLINDAGHYITDYGSSTIYYLALVNNGIISSQGGGTTTIESDFTNNVTNGVGGAMNIYGGSTMVWNTNNNFGFGTSFYNYGTVNVNDGGTLYLTSSGSVGPTVLISNTGNINIGNSSGGATLELNGAYTYDLFGPGGTVTLGNNIQNQIFGNTGSELLVNDAGETIQGAGYITHLDLTNNGTINANGSDLVLQPTGMSTSPGVINNGSMQVQNGSVLYWDAAEYYTGTSLLSPAFNNSSTGTVTVNDGGYLVLVAPSGGESYFNNNGNIAIGGAGSGGHFQINGNNSTFDLGSVGGTGTLTLSDNAYNTIRGYYGNETLINDVGHTIQGAGTIEDLILVNKGTIDATGTNPLNINADPTNTGTMEATNGATLNINQSINNVGGLIQAVGGNGSGGNSTVNLNSVTITGGTLSTTTNATGSGVINGYYSTLDGTAGNTLTNAGQFVVPYGYYDYVEGMINNTGNLQVNGGGGYNTYLYAPGNVTLSGGGTVTLSTTTTSGGGNAYLEPYNGATLTNVNNTIQGEGVIYNSGTTIINEAGGTILANSTGSPLISPLYLEYGTVNNTGLMEATNNGVLILFNNTVNNAGGNITANGPSASVQLQYADVVGGTLNTLNGGTLETPFETTAYLDGSTNGTLTLSTGSTYTADFGSNTYLVGTFVNNGTFLVNGGNGENTYFIVNNGGNTTFQGGGTVTLSTTGGGGNAQLYLDGGASLNNTNNTIQGEGIIYNNSATLDNGGTINANSTGSPLITNLTLEYGTVNNTGLMEATNNGTLQLYDTTVNNGGGNITASGSGASVQLQYADIEGGTLNNNGGAFFGTPSGYYATLDGSTGAGAVTINGTYTSDFGSQTYLNGSIINNDNIQVNGGGGYNTYLYAPANVTLTGGGTVTLSTTTMGGGGNAYLEPYNGATLTNVNNTIQGEGIIYNNGTTIVNEATINANSTGSPLTTTLSLQYGNVTNAGLMEATNSGTLELYDTTVNNANGNITANGAAATVYIDGGTIIQGGMLNGLSGGTLETPFENTAYLDGSTNGTLTLSSGSTYTMAQGSDTYVRGTINNQGTFLVNGGGGYNTYFEVGPGAQTLTLQGGGTITLSTTAAGGGNAQLYLDGGASLNNTNNTIQGEGIIHNNSATLDNGGTINANSTGSPLTTTLSLQYGNVTNAGLMEATNSGTLELYDTTVNNANGNITANGAAATVYIDGGTTIQGGTLNTLSGGTLETPFENTAYLDGSTSGTLTLSTGSTYTMAQGSDTYLKGTINNQGTFQVNGGGGYNTYFEAGPGAQTLTLQGGGTITLSTTAAGGGNAYVYLDSNSTLNNTNNTIQGDGYIQINSGATLINAGTIDANSAGSPAVTNLEVYSGSVTNTGLMEATNNGTLQLYDTTVNNGGGNITASGSGASVQLVEGTDIVGGTLNTGSGGTLGTAFQNTAYLDGSTAAGALTLSTGTTYTLAQAADTYIKGTINNQGTFLVNGGGGYNTYLEIPTQTTTLQGGGTVTLYTVAGGGTAQLYLDGGATLNNVNNTIQGVGIIQNGGTFNNGGTILPGYGLGSPAPLPAGTPGTITLNGAYHQTSTGTFNELISSTAFGVLNVSGTATLDSGSALTITLLGGFDPTNGTTYDFLTYGSATGQFTITDPYFGTGDDQKWVLNSFGTYDQLEAVANVAATITATWTTTSGSWTNAAEWSCTPGPATCVPDNGGGNVYNTGLNSPGNTLTLASGNNITVNTLALNGGTLDIQSGASLNLAGQPNGITDIPNGAGLILAGSFTAGPNSALASLTSVEGYVEIDNGQTTNDTPTTGTLNVASTGDLRLNYGSTLSVTGSLTNSGYVYTGVNGAAGNTLNVTGAFTNNAGAYTYISYSNTSSDVANVASLTNDGYLYIGTNGTVNITGGGQGITDAVAGSSLILFGTLELGGNSAQSGLGSLTSVEGYVEIDNGQTTNDTPNGGTLAVSNTGDLRVNYGSTLNVTGNLTNAGYLVTGASGGAGNTLTVTGALTNNGYTYVGENSVAPDTANVASLTNNGYLWIGPTATMNITGGGQGITDAVAGSSLFLYGTLELGGNPSASGLGSLTSVEGYVEIDNGQTTNDTPNGGTLTVSNTGDLRVNYGSTLNVTGNLTNSGYLYTGVSGGAGNTLTVSGALTNNAGALTWIGYSNTPDTADVNSLTNSGELVIGSKATVNITGGGPGITDAVAGSSLYLYGTLELGGNPAQSGLGSLTSVEGYVEIDNAQTTNDTPIGGTLTISSTGDLRVNDGSTLTVTGNLTNSGYLYTGAGYLTPSFLNVSGTLTTNAGGETWIGISNNADVANVNSLTNNGELGIGPAATLNVTGGGQGITDAVAGSSLYVEGTFELGGNPSASGLGSLTSVEGYVEIDNTQTTNDTPIGGTLTISNTGDLRVNNGSTLTVTGNLTNSGYVYTGVGYSTGSTLNVTGTFTNNAGAYTYVGYSFLPDQVNVGSLANAGYIQVNSPASLNISGSTDTNSGNLTLVGGTLSSPSATGNFDNTGTVTSYPGYPSTISIGGTFTNELGANLTLNNAGDKATIATLANGGTVTVAASALLGVGTGSFTFTSGYQQLATGTLNEILTNATSFGVLNITGSVSLAGPLGITLANGFNPSGDTFDILNYTGSLSGGFSNGPTFSEDGYNWTLSYATSGEVLLTAGVTPTLVGATWSTSSGNWTNPAEWTCSPSYSPCMPNNNPLTAFTATLNSPGNTLTLDSTSSPTTININSLTLTAGTLDIGTGATLNLVSQPGGITDIPAGAGLDVAGTFEVNGGPTSALANLGSVEGTLTLEGQTPTVTPGSGTLTNSGTINVQQTSTLAVTGAVTNSGTINTGNGASDTGNNAITISGLLNNSGGINLYATGDSLSADLTNTGAINLYGNNESLTDGGDFNNNSGGSLALNGGSDSVSVTGNFNNAAGASLTMSGTNGTVSVTEELSNSGTISIASGNTLTTGSWSNLDSSGNLSGGGTYNIGGLFQYGGPSGITNIENGISLTVSGGGEIYDTTTSSNALASLATNAGNFEIDNTNETFTPAGGTFTNSGTFTLGGTVGETITIVGTLANTGTVNLTGNNITLNDDVNNSGAINFSGTNVTQNVTGNFNNNSPGTVSFTGSNGQIIVGKGNAFNNASGATVTMGGTKDTITAGAFNNAGMVTVGATETITTGAGGYTQTAGTTQGFGTINGNVTINGGNIIAGTAGPPGNPGTFTITGNYAQLGGALTAYLEGTTAGPGGYSQLVIGGTATLGGSLDVDLVGGFVPTPGMDFYLLTSAGGDSGSFSLATSDLQVLPPGEGWLLDYSPSSCPYGDSGCLELEVVSAPAGTTPPPAVTPEPSTLVLVATGLLGFAAQRRMKRRSAKPRV